MGQEGRPLSSGEWRHFLIDVALKNSITNPTLENSQKLPEIKKIRMKLQELPKQLAFFKEKRYLFKQTLVIRIKPLWRTQRKTFASNFSFGYAVLSDMSFSALKRRCSFE